MFFGHDIEGLLDWEAGVDKVGEFAGEEDEPWFVETDGGIGCGGAGSGEGVGVGGGDFDWGEPECFDEAEGVGAGGCVEGTGDGFAGGGEGLIGEPWHGR